ncbi:MAG: MFS transporter [Patescibacteria group bacterium]
MPPKKKATKKIAPKNKLASNKIQATKNKKNLSILYLLAFLLAISTALPAYIQSNFLKQFVSLNTLSLFFIVANIGTIIAISVFPNLIKKVNNYFLTKITLLVYGGSLLGLTLASSPSAVLINIILYIISSNLLWINMDVLVESFSANNITGKIRALYFTFMNLGWIFSPLLSSYLISLGGYILTFFVAAILVIPVLLIFLYQAKNLKDNIKYSKEKFSAVLKKMWTNKNLRGILFVALLLNLFFSSAVVYIPIYLHENLGMGWNVLGPIFSIMLIPFILIEIPAGIIADKYLGEKELLFTGFTIITVSLFLFYFVDTPIAWLWAIILFTSRVGAALVEAMREAYFFKIIDAKDVDYINIFRMTGPLGYIIGAGLSIITTLFFPLQYLFLIVTIIMLSSFFFVFSIKDTK